MGSVPRQCNPHSRPKSPPRIYRILEIAFPSKLHNLVNTLGPVLGTADEETGRSRNSASNHITAVFDGNGRDELSLGNLSDRGHVWPS